MEIPTEHEELSTPYSSNFYAPKVAARWLECGCTFDDVKKVRQRSPACLENVFACMNDHPNPPIETPPKDQEFCRWFTGFFDGEGSINLQGTRKLKLQIDLRADDAHIAVDLVRKLGGAVYYQPADPKKQRYPKVQWRIIDDGSRGGVLFRRVIVPLFDHYGLRSKKQEEYRIWRELVGKRPTVRRPRCNMKDKGRYSQLTKIYEEVWKLYTNEWESAHEKIELLRKPWETGPNHFRTPDRRRKKSSA